MKIQLKRIKISEVCKDYINNENEEGVIGYNGKLNIRPKFQREFVYDDKKRNAVIESIIKDFPLNVMYWIDKEDGTYEMLDGQQRTISIGDYIIGKYSINSKYFHSLTKTEQDQILNYDLLIYFCIGNDKEIQDWFSVINIAGEKLTDQELRNAIYTGPWLEDAKRHFSKTGCPAYQIGEKYINAVPIRQEYLEIALKWISSIDDIKIEDYMTMHQNDSDANELWQYYQNVINWIEMLYLDTNKNALYKNKMTGVQWGILYNKYHDHSYNSNKIKEEAEKLFSDPYVSDKKGIFEYVLTNHKPEDLRLINIRVFDDVTKLKVYKKQNGVCPDCVAQGVEKHYELSEMEADHVSAWSRGGATTEDNCQLLCIHHNRLKGNK